MTKGSLSLLAAIFSIYALIVYIAIYTPMHSDDFPYSVIGTGVKRHFEHYMSWSGRIVADYVSAFILSLHSHYASALINSLGSVLLIYNIAALPEAISKNYKHKQIALTSIVIFLLYWVGNPNLGQVMFWIVGSANYMWTTLIIIFSIRTAIKIKEEKYDTAGNRVYLFALFVLAGCSNENTSVTTCAMVAALLLWYRVHDGKIHKGLASAFAGVVTGTSILILAPGNYARAGGASLDAWRESSLFSKAYVLIFETLPTVMSLNWYVFLSIIIAAMFAIAFPKRSHKTLWLTFGFFLCFLCSNMVMVAAPGYPPRTMNGQFIFLLCAFSLILSQTDRRAFTYQCIVILCLLLIYFVPSYYSVMVNYQSAYKQSFVRTRIIEEAISKHQSSVSIPNWYFSRFTKSGLVFDTYHSPWMYLYYGNGIKKITTYPVGFDYSVIDEDYRFNLQGVSFNKEPLKSIYAYDDKLQKQAVFVIESENPMRQGDDYMLFVKPVLKSGEVVSKGTSLPFRTVEVDGRHFTYVKIKHVKIENISGVRVGFYDYKTGKVISQIDVK
ncbi:MULTISPECIES: DUF6056 family protein [Pantoea]|uniref:DUF6056 family protein n=1 Tax=Pantoea TaxID=53335 RepID=UPI0025797F0E|nr:DUF6056 family protein [Pantoea sp. UBA5960]